MYETSVFVIYAKLRRKVNSLVRMGHITKKMIDAYKTGNVR